MERVYILGGGAVGAPLAAFLTMSGREVVLVRMRSGVADSSQSTWVEVTMGDESIRAKVPTVAFEDLRGVNGVIVVTCKTYANERVAEGLRRVYRAGPIVLAQNGLNVERAFQDQGFPNLGRAVLYLTSQSSEDRAGLSYQFRSIADSLVGTLCGDAREIREAVKTLQTDRFPFSYCDALEGPVFKKAIVNVIFNSICPLLDVDNGIFARGRSLLPLVRSLIRECLQLVGAKGLELSEEEILESVERISQNSPQLISTLQDLRAGRQTEIDSLNFAFVEMAEGIDPEMRLPLVHALGDLIRAKSELSGSSRI
nr:ketopantoate reductase C-terminal domain-containing protein [Puniceicoccus vermicola]